jgi:hypothetical protein
MGVMHEAVEDSVGEGRISSGCVTIHARYFAMTSTREPSRPMTKGLPHLLGRPM